MHNLCNLAFSTGFEPVSRVCKANLSGTVSDFSAIHDIKAVSKLLLYKLFRETHLLSIYPLNIFRY